MKRVTVCMFFVLIAILVSAPQSYAQSEASPKSAQPNQEQVMRELLSEVRQLRLDVRRIAGNAYRAQTMIERLRLQQGQVNRLTLELSKVRGQISDLKTARVALKEEVAAVQRKYDVGVLPSSEMNALKARIEGLDQREPDLTTRESQLAGELSVEQANLEKLSTRLDEIERELLTITRSEEDKPGKREP